MIKTLTGFAGALALVSFSAAANPAALATNDASASPSATMQTEATPGYTAAPATASFDMTAADVATQEDARKLAELEFLRADVNVDGSIDKAEFVAFTTPPSDAAAAPVNSKAATADSLFVKIAKNDAAISQTDLIDARIKSFDEADADDNRSLSAKEKQRFAAMLAAKPAAAVKTQ